MTEMQDTIALSHKELAALLVKHADIHQGHWGIHLELALSGGTFPVLSSPNSTFTLMPVGIVAIAKIGIHKFDQPNPLTVDASEINPAPQQGTKL